MFGDGLLFACKGRLPEFRPLWGQTRVSRPLGPTSWLKIYCSPKRNPFDLRPGGLARKALDNDGPRDLTVFRCFFDSCLLVFDSFFRVCCVLGWFFMVCDRWYNNDLLGPLRGPIRLPGPSTRPGLFSEPTLHGANQLEAIRKGAPYRLLSSRQAAPGGRPQTTDHRP